MKYAARGTKDQNQNLVECAPPLLVAHAVRWLAEKMITISRTNWFSRPRRHLPTTRDIYEPIFLIWG